MTVISMSVGGDQRLTFHGGVPCDLLPRERGYAPSCISSVETLQLLELVRTQDS